MRRRATPRWFTDGKTREKIQKWWPWVFSAFAATLYAINPDPIEQIRVGSLAAARKPLLRGLDYLEQKDLDPETLALELPPQLLFGPLALGEQIKFALYALRHDDDLADDYVTRLVIDHMDMSLDPPRTDALVKAGAKELVDFAVEDFTDRRTNRKRKFFGPDQFLRLVNMIAPYHELATHLIEKLDGVGLVFQAMSQAENEYARVLAMRSLTLFALLQSRDGLVEQQILQGGHLAALVDAYRLSTGDPTDTRFPTMLLSSIMRIFKDNEAVYNSLVAENVVSAVVQNLNLTRYKGVPQHLRILNDLREMRQHLAGKVGAAAFNKPTPVGMDDVEGGVGGVPRPVMPAPRSRLQAYFAKEEDEARLKRQKEMSAGVKMLPPRDLHAPVESLAYDSEFLPVALGVMDVFPEYFEASTEMLHWVDALIKAGVTNSFELLEYRGASVLAKVVGRLEREPHFFAAGGTGELVRRLCTDMFNDPDCAPFVRDDNNLGSLEMRTAVRNLKEFVERFDRTRNKLSEEGVLSMTREQQHALRASAGMDRDDNSFAPFYKRASTPMKVQQEAKQRVQDAHVKRIIEGAPHVPPSSSLDDATRAEEKSAAAPATM